MGTWDENRHRLQSMQPCCRPSKRKKDKHCHSDDPALLLRPFEYGKRKLALTFRENNFTVQRKYAPSTRVDEILSSLPRASQTPQRDSSYSGGMGSYLSHSTNFLRCRNDGEKSVKEFITRTACLENAARNLESTIQEGGAFYNDQFMRAKAHLRDTDLTELEDYKKRVQAVEDGTTFPTENDGVDANVSTVQEQLSSLGPRIAFSTAAPSSSSYDGDVERSLQASQASRWGGELLGQRRDSRLNDLEAEIERTKSKLTALLVTKRDGFVRSKQRSESEKGKPSAAFSPLSEEEEEQVDNALKGSNRHNVLVSHDKSNIDITRAVMQCLLPGVWLNDEVINLYMELLKERELREPNGFLKCHFFNTFFYNKLFKDKHSYDFKAVKRWTTQRKLGYNLLDCDKILVPIHKDIHWCIAIINVREKKFEYLDSLKGRDRNALDVLAKPWRLIWYLFFQLSDSLQIVEISQQLSCSAVLFGKVVEAKYIVDEAKDKLGKDLDVTAWKRSFPEDIPEQLNGCDCGMFMVKYADFHSRGFIPTFSQGHMGYFRRKMVLELLQLKAK